MDSQWYLHDLVVFLFATVIVVPVFERLRASPLVGYLLAGAVIGPNGIKVIDDPDGVRSLAELGVVMLLFTIGLELTMERFRLFGLRAFALGAAQVAVTGLVLGGLALAAGLSLTTAVVVGGALALSSTAVVLQLLVERHELNTRLGRQAVGVLLLQDLAVGPFLVLIPLLGGTGGDLWAALGGAGVRAVLVLAGILIGGRLVLRPLFRLIDWSKTPELSMALILATVLGTGMITHWAGLSMALGAFVAGMVLAETEYRHKVMTDIQPFRGLMLGLFFMAVGMYIDVGLVIERPGLILGLILGVLAIKAVILTGLARVFGSSWVSAGRLGLLLAQGGGFTFVLLNLAVTHGVLPETGVQVLMLAVAATMIVTPLLAMAGGWMTARYQPGSVPGLDELYDAAGRLDHHLVICGFGQTGKLIAQRFRAQGLPFLVLDTDAKKVIDGVAQGVPIFQADALQPEALDGAGVDHCQAVIVALGEARGARRLVGLLRYLFPKLRILARARDEQHGRQLVLAGADDVAVEVQEAGDRLAGAFILPLGP